MILTTKVLRIAEGVLLGLLVTTEISLAAIMHKKQVAAIEEQQKIFKESVRETNEKMMKDANEVADMAKEMKEEAEKAMKDLAKATKQAKKLEQGVA